MLDAVKVYHHTSAIKISSPYDDDSFVLPSLADAQAHDLTRPAWRRCTLHGKASDDMKSEFKVSISSIRNSYGGHRAIVVARTIMNDAAMLCSCVDNFNPLLPFLILCVWKL